MAGFLARLVYWDEEQLPKFMPIQHVNLFGKKVFVDDYIVKMGYGQTRLEQALIPI